MHTSPALLLGALRVRARDAGASALTGRAREPLYWARGRRTRPWRAAPRVGRAAELATARGLVDAVAAAGAGALLVAGEAGIGKTRLLDEVAGRAREHGLPVLSGGRCRAAGRSGPSPAR